MPVLRAFLISMATCLLSPLHADACSCVPCETATDARDGYGVFLHLGKVEILGSYPLPRGDTFDESIREIDAPIRQLIVKPKKMTRGAKRHWLLIHDEQCGLWGEVGDEILVAVHQKTDGRLYSSSCAVYCAVDLNWLHYD